MTVRPSHMFIRPNLRSASQQNGGVDFCFGNQSGHERPDRRSRRGLLPAQKHTPAVGFLVSLNGGLARVHGTATVLRLLMDETT